jgi:hypothetical protein
MTQSGRSLFLNFTARDGLDMDSEKLHDWLQIVGLAAVVGSLIFVGLQVKQEDDIAFAEVAESTSTRGIQQRALVADHADTWQKACLGSELTAAEKVIAGNIYTNYIQGNYNTWERLELTGIGESFSNRFLTDSFAANIHRYPGFARMARSSSEWDELGVRRDAVLVERYVLALFERLAELKQLEPNPNADVMWCGVK